MNAVEFCRQLEKDLSEKYDVPVRVEQEKVLAGSDYRFIVYEIQTSSNQIGFTIDLDWYGIRLELESADYFVKSSSLYNLWRRRLCNNRDISSWYQEQLCKENGQLSYLINDGEFLKKKIDDEMLEREWYLFNLIFDDDTVRTHKKLDIQYNSIYQIIELFWGLVLSFTAEDSFKDMYHEEEGIVRSFNSIQYERSRINRNVCLAIHGTKCKICGFDFEEFYGDIGKAYIEVHHIEPISSFKKPKCVNPLTDLIPVCSNCHSMLHRKTPPFQPDEIKQKIVEEGHK